jgi:hypothetical protein
VAADNTLLRRDSDPIRYWEEGCDLSEYTMTAVIE